MDVYLDPECGKISLKLNYDRCCALVVDQQHVALCLG
jgi:hypothetical protein